MANLLRAIDARLAAEQLGRAHHRALHFIARRPDLTVGALLGLLDVTKQSLGRTLGELTARGLVETRTGRDDRRQRLLRLTPAGAALEADLFEALRATLAAAYSSAGPARGRRLLAGARGPGARRPRRCRPAPRLT